MSGDHCQGICEADRENRSRYCLSRFSHVVDDIPAQTLEDLVQLGEWNRRALGSHHPWVAREHEPVAAPRVYAKTLSAAVVLVPRHGLSG